MIYNEGSPEPAASGSVAPSNAVVPVSAPSRGGGPPRLYAWPRQPPSWLGAWVPFLATFVSLWFSVSAYVEATRDPEVTLVMPDQVRITDTRFPDVYLQPTFLSTGNNRVEVVRNMSMQLELASGGEPVYLAWVGQGKWEYDASFDALTYVPGADAAPMLVSPSSPQVPVAVFRNVEPVEWGVQPSDCRLVLTATREIVPTPAYGCYGILNTINNRTGNLGTTSFPFYAAGGESSSLNQHWGNIYIYNAFEHHYGGSWTVGDESCYDPVIAPWITGYGTISNPCTNGTWTVNY